MPPSFITLSLDFDPDHLATMEAALDKIGNPLRSDLQARLDAAGVVHFFSMNAVPPEKAPGAQAHLVIEMTADGPADTAVRAWAEALAPALGEVLAQAHIGGPGDSGVEIICKPENRIDAGTGWFSPAGIAFTGTPDMTVRRILDEAELAAHAMTLVAVAERGPRPALQILQDVQAKLIDHARFAPFLKDVLPAPFLTGERSTVSNALPLLLRLALTGIFWPISLLIGLGGVASLFWGVHAALNEGSGILAAGLSGVAHLFWFLIGSAALLAASALAAYFALRRREADDPADDRAPDDSNVQAIMQRENALLGAGPAARGELRDPDSRIGGTAVAQNHLFAISDMKPGLFRRLTLRLAFWVIATFAERIFRPGFLGQIGTIHAARWVLLPRTGQLLFFSNYGGSWESYLEDFITKAHAGLTGVWSNTAGFPRTANLFMQGATDGDRFKRWARCQQRPTRAWYSAYPHLNTARIRVNAAIRQGLTRAVTATESEALDWLSCFNSAPMTAEKLEAGDIQALAYSGMSKLPSARAVALRMGDDAKKNRQWLAEIETIVTTAEKVPERQACIVGLSAKGLARLGLTKAALSSFPSAFQHGMDADWRARLLGDIDDDAPECWKWGNEKNPAHAILLLYAANGDEVDGIVAEEKARARSYGLKEMAVIQLQDRATDKRAGGGAGPMLQAVDAAGLLAGATGGSRFEREPFGFADGISQPIVKGTPRALKMAGETDHLIEAGEIILGYRDNRGYVPPSPIVPADEDLSNMLTTLAVDPSRQRPDFTLPEALLPRDLGRNGSFLVVRQLQQHVDRFESFLEEAASKLSEEQRSWIELPQGVTLKAWIGAKMIGRWDDGTSMARHANASPTGQGRRRPDNRFRFGEDDPAGFGCPLGAHVRRTNPRESLAPASADQLAITNRHRILRAGRAYTAGDKEKGLLFMCLNADIERQFEFIQQTWCLATQFHGLDNEADPILGRRLKSTHFTIPTPQGPIRIDNLQKFITMRGGGYFFMPGRRALRWMARSSGVAQARPVTFGQNRAA